MWPWLLLDKAGASATCVVAKKCCAKLGEVDRESQ